MSRAPRTQPDRASILAAAALIVATAALVVAAFGGFAGAAPGRVVVKRVVVHKGKVRKGDIAPGAVTTAAIAHGAVTEGKIRKGAVSVRKLGPGAVTAEAIAPDAVTAGAIAPGSVYGGALGAETVVTKPIADLDTVPHNGEWTASNAETALCGPGERLLGGGFSFTNPGNREAAWLEALPSVGEASGVTGRITTDSGGTAAAAVAAICLK